MMSSVPRSASRAGKFLSSRRSRSDRLHLTRRSATTTRPSSGKSSAMRTRRRRLSCCVIKTYVTKSGGCWTFSTIARRRLSSSASVSTAGNLRRLRKWVKNLVSRGSAFGSCKILRFPNCAVRSRRKSDRWMWSCPSKLKLDEQCRFDRPQADRCRMKDMTRPTSRVPIHRWLFQLALDLFHQVQVLLDHFCGVIRELLHVGIAPAVCFLFEFSQIFFVILHHHVDVSFV